jgi:hypothetical protein
MKKVLLIAGIATYSFASAQEKGQPYWKVVPPLSKKVIPLPPGNNFSTQSLTLPPGIQLLGSLPNGNKIYALPQDNMPCVIPDMSQYNSMPVVKPDLSLYNMPNLANPNGKKPGVISPEKFNELLKERNVIIKMN